MLTELVRVHQCIGINQFYMLLSFICALLRGWILFIYFLLSTSFMIGEIFWWLSLR